MKTEIVATIMAITMRSGGCILLIFSMQMFSSYRNQPIGLQWKSIDWFLHEGNYGVEKDHPSDYISAFKANYLLILVLCHDSIFPLQEYVNSMTMNFLKLLDYCNIRSWVSQGWVLLVDLERDYCFPISP